MRSMHPECLKIFMMQYLMTKSNPLQKKEESVKNQGLWQVVYCKLPNIEIKVILENKKGET